MFDRLRKLLSRAPKAPEPAPPPPPPMLPGVVAAEGAITMGAHRRPAGLSVEAVGVIAIEEALALGITDPDKMREMKLAAREAMKAARAVALAEKRPVEFTIGRRGFTVRPT